MLQEATKTSGLNIILEMNAGLNLQVDLELISLRGRIVVSTSTLFMFSLHTLCCRGSVCTQTSSYCKMGGQWGQWERLGYIVGKGRWGLTL